MNTWLLLDISNLAYRSFFSTGELSFDGAKTGVPFGVFRDVLMLQELHRADETIFCFDVGRPKRCDMDHRYKRKEDKGAFDEALSAAKSEVRNQLDRLRTKYLPAVGFRNLLWQEGYEADDVIASVCHHLPDDTRAVVVSTDEDLYQLLVKDSVLIWNPRKKRAVTEESFVAEWGLDPNLWADVKALAGCSSDNVVGIKGVGEKTAAKYLSGQLKSTAKAWRSIWKAQGVWEHNLKLTRLPLLGVRRFKLRKDEVTPKRWNRVLERLGIKSLMGRV